MLVPALSITRTSLTISTEQERIVADIARVLSVPQRLLGAGVDTHRSPRPVQVLD
ncbi:MAG: hypothetical protein KJ061_19660 [Vicinamibacteraceae bacterium]|nr:hypothetical protein [Vicinamibacteraceae bacterium]